jgi:hypothetical protein
MAAYSESETSSARSRYVAPTVKRIWLREVVRGGGPSGLDAGSLPGKKT